VNLIRNMMLGCLTVAALVVTPAARADQWQKSSDGYWYYYSDNDRHWYYQDGKTWQVYENGKWVDSQGPSRQSPTYQQSPSYQSYYYQPDNTYEGSYDGGYYGGYDGYWGTPGGYYGWGDRGWGGGAALVAAVEAVVNRIASAQ